uniref:NADH-ubiquinone oxidoreductase chain 3 n=1 Tax=Phyxioschema suthepium TaxID=1155482 RepID=L7NW29_9ARAC|nr:NADH dehydrogenase subunit 3 [Phyxioschema suthepium]AFC77862.1 NADH dehydrogenase subunit 3 [Phyxioschema suthepium]
MMFFMIMEVMILSVVIMMLFFWMSKGEEDKEGVMSSYECGFDSGVMSRMSFSYRFFLISILFLIFDVEIVLMLPFPYQQFGLGGLIGVMIMMMILLGGLVYEYYWGTLVWVK